MKCCSLVIASIENSRTNLGIILYFNVRNSSNKGFTTRKMVAVGYILQVINYNINSRNNEP